MARKRKYSDEQIIAALKSVRGMVYLAADKIGCVPDTIYDRAKISPEVAATIKMQRGKVVDLAETRLYDAIEAGEPWALQLALKTLGRDRGYVERHEQEITGAGGGAVVVKVLGPGQSLSDI